MPEAFDIAEAFGLVGRVSGSLGKRLGAGGTRLSGWEARRAESAAISATNYAEG